MIELRCDEQGFLIGDKKSSQPVIAGELSDIAKDISAIKDLLNKARQSQSSDSSTDNKIDKSTSISKKNNARSNIISIDVLNSGDAKQQNSSTINEKAVDVALIEEIVNSGKNEIKSFVSANNANQEKSTEKITTSVEKSAISIGSAINVALKNNNETDPALTAANEILTPINNTIGLIPKRTDSTPWFKRLFKHDNNQHNELKADNNQTHKILKSIDNKIGEKNGGWLTTLLPVLFAILAGIAKLPLSIAKFLPKSIGGLLSKLLPKKKDICCDDNKLGKKGRETQRRNTTGAILPSRGQQRGGQQQNQRSGGRLLSHAKKLPVVGAVVGGIYGLLRLNEINNDPNLSDEQKFDKKNEVIGGVAGGVGGAAVGAAIGTAILPVVGTAIGGALGAWLGSEAGQFIAKPVGRWINELSNGDLINKIQNSFNSWVAELKEKGLVNYMSEKWDSFIDSAGSLWKDLSASYKEASTKFTEQLSSFADSANSFFKKHFGIDIKETVATTVSETKEVANSAVNWIDKKATSINESIKKHTSIDVKQSVSDGINAVSEFGGKVWNAIGGTAKKGYEKAVELTVNKQPIKKESATAKRWDKAKHDIVSAANKAGVDAGVLANIAHFESMGFNSNARPISKSKPHLNTVRQFDGKMAMSSAHGYGQFIDSTWRGMINKYGKKYGIENAGNLTKKQANKYRTNTKIQAAMLAEFTKENVKKGRKLGGHDDLSNVYALHNLGSGDGAKFLKALNMNPNASVSSVLSKNVINRNTSLYKNGNITLKEAYAKMGKKMRGGDVYAAEARAMQDNSEQQDKKGFISKAKTAVSNKITVAKETLSNLKLPEIVSRLRVKDGEADEGGYNSPEALYATALIQEGLGDNFNKTDFTIKNISHKEAESKAEAILTQKGLVRGVHYALLNEYEKPSANSTGGHFDFRLSQAGHEKIQSIMLKKQIEQQKMTTLGDSVSPLMPPISSPMQQQLSAVHSSSSSINKSIAQQLDPPQKIEASIAKPQSELATQIANIAHSNNNSAQHIAQDISDRRIAHNITGGLSSA